MNCDSSWVEMPLRSDAHKCEIARLLVIGCEHNVSGGQTRIVEDCYVAPIRVDVFQRIVATIDILVQSVRGIEDSIVRDVDCVGRHPAAHAGGMVARAEVVQPTLAIAFFAGRTPRRAIADSDPVPHHIDSPKRDQNLGHNSGKSYCG